MGDAAAITTTITNFKHSGSVMDPYSNPFDSIYPWKYRKLCKVDRVAYAALAAGAPIEDAVSAWEGEPGFVLDGLATSTASIHLSFGGASGKTRPMSMQA